MNISRKLVSLVIMICFMSLSANSEFMDFFIFRDALALKRLEKNRQHAQSFQIKEQTSHEVKKARRSKGYKLELIILSEIISVFTIIYLVCLWKICSWKK